MNAILQSGKWIMITAGLMTCTMFFAAIAPQAALQSTFGETLQGPLAEVVVRNWGVLITLIGAMLIYAAFDPPIQRFALTIAAISKIAFIGLVLLQGQHFLGQQVAIAIAIDFVWVALFTMLLVRKR